MPAALGRRVDQYPEWEAVGQPVVLLLGAAYANGGRAAERAVLQRLLAALAPFRRQGAPPAEVGAQS